MPGVALAVAVSPVAGAVGVGGGPAAATFVCTTVGAATLTIQDLSVSAEVLVDWGDASSDLYTGTGTRTHDYAGAGTWTVTITDPLLVTTFDLRDSKCVVTSAGLRVMANIDVSFLHSIKAGLFNTADLVDWRPSYVYWGSWVAGSAGTFDSADLVDWRPTTFYFTFMPSNYVATLDTADVADWRPTIFHVSYMPASVSVAVTPGSMSLWSSIVELAMSGLGLLQADVDALLADLYAASVKPRTVSDGTITVAGTNAAPSGTFQAAASCPVDGSTPGKEISHELLNDGCGEGFNAWATVTTS